MKEKYKFDFDESERNLIIKSLSLFHNHLSAQNKETDFIDEIIIKLNDKNKIDLDKYEFGIIVNSVNSLRYKLKNTNESRTEINRVLLKMLDKTDRKTIKESYAR